MILESVASDGMSPVLLAEIQDFLDSQNTGHPFQFPQWAGSGSRVMLVRKDGRICWLGTFGVQKPLGRRFPWLRALNTNRGPVCDDHRPCEAVADELAQSMREESFAYLDVLPEWIRQVGDDHPNFANNCEWHSLGMPRSSQRLDLAPAEEEIVANFRKTTRYEVRRAERLGATVSTASSDREIDEFLCVYQRMASQKNFIPDAIDNLRRVIHWLISEESRGTLLIGCAGGMIRGGAIIARSGHRCWYILGANDREGDMAVGHILQWRAVLWAKSHGCTEYDFGGYTPGSTSGPAWFKEGFGGTVVHLVAPHRRTIERKRYNVFRAISGISSWM